MEKKQVMLESRVKAFELDGKLGKDEGPKRVEEAPESLESEGRGKGGEDLSGEVYLLGVRMLSTSSSVVTRRHSTNFSFSNFFKLKSF